MEISVEQVANLDRSHEPHREKRPRISADPRSPYRVRAGKLAGWNRFCRGVQGV
jgi:hypothetical protein